jgi:hypothetical protein
MNNIIDQITFLKQLLLSKTITPQQDKEINAEICMLEDILKKEYSVNGISQYASYFS